MSSIKLAPNASGTGEFTIAAPNSNTNRTLTLPDVAGTFVTADASGNVGIGTSSPNPISWGRSLTLNTTSNGAYDLAVNGSEMGYFYANSSLVGVGSYANVPLAFYTNNTERARIDTSGNLTLRTGGSSNVTHTFTYNELGSEITLNDNTGNIGTLLDLSNGVTRMLHVLTTGNQQIGLGGSATGVLQFMRAGYVEAARIDSSGRLLVGTTTSIANGLLAVRNTGAEACSFQGGSNNFIVTFHNTSGTLIGSITGSTGSTTSYNTSSDYRLKEDIQPMTGALAKVAALKPVTYKWKADGSDGQGFIAHELAEVCPDAVSGEKDAVNEDGSIKPQGIDTSFLVATLTAAIQEQQAMIQTLTARIEALEAK